jgi:transposase-like protein
MATRARRDSSKEDFWRRLIRGQAGSGLSVRAWCRRRGVHEAAFYWWRRELARRDADPPATAFVPVRLTEDGPAKSDPVIEILLTNGRRMRLWRAVERPMLAEVLAVLEGPGC